MDKANYTHAANLYASVKHLEQLIERTKKEYAAFGISNIKYSNGWFPICSNEKDDGIFFDKELVDKILLTIREHSELKLEILNSEFEKL